MDFYAFLPSNSNPNLYPDNKTSYFKTQLANRLELHGDWQAALVELHYPNTIAQVSEGENEIIIQTDRTTDFVTVRPGCYQNRKEFLSAVSTALSIVDNNLPPGTGVEVDADHRVIFHPVSTEPGGKVFFSPRLALQLGLDGHGPFQADQELRGVKPVDMSLGIPPQMFIYLDILSDQIIGHARAPLLRTVPVDTKAQYGTMSIKHFDHPIYFDLCTKSFDTIQCYIKDHAGRPVPYDFGTLTLLVHFQKVRR